MTNENIPTGVSLGRQVIIWRDGERDGSTAVITAMNPAERRIQVFGLMESGCYLGPVWMALWDGTGVWRMLSRDPKGNLYFDTVSRGDFMIHPKIT